MHDLYNNYRCAKQEGGGELGVKVTEHLETIIRNDDKKTRHRHEMPPPNAAVVY